MQDYRQDVFVAAEGILGELSSPQAQLLLMIVEAVCLQMDKKLKKGISNVHCRNAYIPACAMYAASFLRGVDQENLSAFTAGTVSLSFHEGSSSLTRLADELMAPWLAAPVIFRGVRA